MKTSDEGRNLIKSLEGLSLTAYPDGGGYSIGYGHHGGGLKLGDRITAADAESLFAEDVARFESAVSAVMGGTTQAQFDALVSLAYNIGVGAFNQSTLLQLHNARKYSLAAEQFDVWRKSGGAVNPALVKRRARERAVYVAGSPADGLSGAPYEPAPSSYPPPAPVVFNPSFGGAAIFFCPCCGGRCSAQIVVSVEP